jgi:C-terminal processing protease CtpA/Prc
MRVRASSGIAAFLCSVAMLCAPAAARTQPAPAPDRRQLAEVANLLRHHYVFAIPHDSLMAAAREVFDGTLDRYTSWLEPVRATALQRTLTGTSGTSVAPLPVKAQGDVARWTIGDSIAIGYVRIDHFSLRTPAELDTVLADVTRHGVRALVLDLRGDLGGAVAGACAVADRFLESGIVVRFESRHHVPRPYRVHAGHATALPLAVLIDERTASAAEMLAACLQDHHRGLVVGSRSFGKGVVLGFYPLKRMGGTLKMTTTLYVRPSGRPIERWIPRLASAAGGVWPDSGLAVAPAAAVPDSAASRDDPVLRRAVSALTARVTAAAAAIPPAPMTVARAVPRDAESN